MGITAQYNDMYLNMPNYTLSDYIPFVEHCFNHAIMRFNEAGWAPIQAPVLHRPATEPRSTQSREMVGAECLDPNVARVF